MKLIDISMTATSPSAPRTRRPPTPGAALAINPTTRGVLLQRRPRYSSDRPDYADITVGGHYPGGRDDPDGVREVHENSASSRSASSTFVAARRFCAAERTHVFGNQERRNPSSRPIMMSAALQEDAMFAHQVVEFSGPAGVVWTELPEPASRDGVIVDVVAAGVSFADLLQTQGRYQLALPLPFTPGMDAAGVVRTAAPGAGVDAGQRVAVLRSHGCWQEVLAADPDQVLPLPDDMSFDAGAAAPLNYLTGLFALVRRGRAQSGETLLVHGGAGGVGVAAIQLGRALGLRTIAVTSDGCKREFALRCGAHHAVLSNGWLDAVRGLVGERAVDLVFDPVGGDRVTDSLRSLAPEGRLLVVGFTAGEIPTVKVNRLLLGNIGVLGVASREFFERHPPLVRDLWARLLELRGTGALPDLPVVAYPFGDAGLALRALANRQTKGKSVLSRRRAALG